MSSELEMTVSATARRPNALHATARVSLLLALLSLVPGCSCTAEGPAATQAGEAGASDDPGAPPSGARAAPDAGVAVEERVEESEENPLAIADGTADPEAGEAEDGRDPEPSGADAPATAEPEERFPLAGVAFHFAADVLAEPEPSAPVIGYLRRGARVRVAEKASGPGCSRGWYRIEGGGYVCHGGSVIVGEDPAPWPDSPPAPRLDAPMPYDYHGVVRDDVPEYWERPTPEMEAATAAAIRRLRAPPSAPAPPPAGPGADAGADADAADATDGSAPPPRAAAPAPSSARDAGPDGGAGGPRRALPSYVRLLLARGFIVSGTLGEGRWFRTVRGRHVERTFLSPREGPTFRGVELGPDDSLPIAFVVRGRAKSLRQSEGPRLRFEAAGELARLSSLPVLGEVVRDNQSYVSVGRGLFARSDALALVEAVERPPEVGPTERWIDVHLSAQTLVAYEGDRPVYATLISSGREADGFGTPTGTFRIRTKHVSTTMDDPDAGSEAYSIEDVPWTMYFQDGYALHGAFWHSQFGRQRSHGCVNLSPADARWVFFWSEPHLPPGWHGVRATRSHPGTAIVVRP